MASPYYTTKDGFEAQIGTNHLGPFVFTNLILPRILASKTGSPRIVSVSSAGHFLSPVKFDDPSFQGGKAYAKWEAYGQSKTANILFAKELVKRYGSKSLIAFSLHPGTIQTNLSRDIKLEELGEPISDYQGNL